MIGVYAAILIFGRRPDADIYAVGDVVFYDAYACLIIGHAYNALAEVARIEAITAASNP